MLASQVKQADMIDIVSAETWQILYKHQQNVNTNKHSINNTKTYDYNTLYATISVHEGNGTHGQNFSIFSLSKCTSYRQQ